jgi:hypothetical protein
MDQQNKRLESGRRTQRHLARGQDFDELAYEDEYTDYEYGPEYEYGRPVAALPQPRLSKRARIIWTLIFILIAFGSFFLGDIASSPDTHSATINVLDQKKNTVMGLVGASTASSTAITLIPGDAGTPIAEKLVDLSSDFLIVVAAIYLEKYLLTIAGFVAFKIMIPVASAFMIAFVNLPNHYYTIKSQLSSLAVRLFILGVAMYMIVPTSVFLSSMIEATYQESIETTIEQASQTTQRIEEATNEKEGEQQPDLLTTLQNLPNTVTENLTKWVDEAKESLNGFIEALAVMVVTSCIIPILVLVFFLWLIKTILGVQIEAPMRMIYPRTLRHIKRRSPKK